MLAVYTGASLNALTEVVSNDDIRGPLNRQSRVAFSATTGTTYRIAVDGYAGATGAIELNWSYQCRLVGTNSLASHFLVTIQGLPQQNYLLERSDDLILWFPEAVVSTELSGTATHDAGPISAISHRFYRATFAP